MANTKTPVDLFIEAATKLVNDKQKGPVRGITGKYDNQGEQDYDEYNGLPMVWVILWSQGDPKPQIHWTPDLKDKLIQLAEKGPGHSETIKGITWKFERYEKKPKEDFRESSSESN
ncbi:hypothetical protein EG329_008908 [Mollisiaceae sp. DMI_Dod_QoI]|nr:hypothetical protein EG329_008908 [Helotiales sp. DMI_Dod_QoI]